MQLILHESAHNLVKILSLGLYIYILHNTRIEFIIGNSSTTTFLWPISSPVSNDLNVFNG